MNTRAILAWFLLASFSCLLPCRQAQAQPVSVDSTAWGPMNGFDLYGNGIYWWNDGQVSDEINPSRTGQIAIRSLLAGRGLAYSSSKPHFSLQSTFLRARHQSVARNEEWMFYFSGPSGGLSFRKRAIFGANPPDIDFASGTYTEAGAILINGSTVYFCARGGIASNAGEVRYKDINGLAGGGDILFKSGMGLVKKMKIVTLVNEENLAIQHYLLLLNTDGQLWHIRLPSVFDPTTGSLTLYTGNVTDFDVRTEFRSEFVPPFSFRLVYGTRIYATTGVGLGDNRTSGRLYSFNFTSGGTVLEHDTGNINQQLTSVAIDGERIFVTLTPLRFDSSLGWGYDWVNGGVFRQFAPVNRDLSRSGFGLIAVGEGRNLRSDTQWLYYAHLHQIWKIKTDTPALALDYRAVGLEAVQSVQDFNNSVPIVAGKPTLVRGYGQLVQNTTGRAKFRLTARLRAFRNGAQLPGETYAYNRPIIDGAADLPTLRTNLNRSFHFDLPSEWVSQPGPLQLHMMVNANGTAPETGEAPFANNTAVTTINIVPARVPCLVFKAMSSPMGNYEPGTADSGFWDIVDRAVTLMPVSGFNVRFSPGSVRKPVFPFGANAFFMPDDKDWALLWMTVAHAFTRDPNGCVDTHWVGMFPANIGTWNGVGGARGVSLRDLIPETPFNVAFPRTALDNTSVVRMNPGQGNSSNPWNTVGGGNTLAHELGHNYGRFHINQSASGCGGSTPEGPYHFMPFGINACTLGITDLNNPAAPVGYDPRTDTLVAPNMAADLMTYGNSRWISPFTWNALVGAIPAHVPPGAMGFAPAGEGTAMLNPQPLPPGGVYLAQGVINPVARSVTMLPSFQVPNGVLDDAKIQESLGAVSLPASMPYKLRLLNAVGTVLDERAIIPLVSSEGEEGRFAFVQAVPNVPGSTRMQVLEGGTVLNETTASPNAPTLALQSPVVNASTETLSLQWTASDADNDPLLFSVQFTHDNGVSWETISVHDPAPGFTVSTRLLRGGNACRLRVVATDGFRTTLAETGSFIVPKHAPSIILKGARDQQQIPFNSNVAVRIFAYDAEDGSIDSELISWSITGPENQSGRGAKFSLQGLAPGNYTLTASAPDLDGNTGSTAISLKVRPIEVPDGSTPEVDGICDEVYPEASEVRLIPGQAAPAVRLVHSSGALYVCFDGLPYSDPNGAPANINFYIDGDGLPTTSPQVNDVGFGVDENGIPARARGTGSGWTSETPQGFEVKILRAAASWSAEFRVPDSALNGWNHNAALTFLFGSSLGAPVNWPGSANVFDPSTWTALSLGPLPVLSNRPPVAVASGPAVVSYAGSETVALDGSGSYDLDGDALSFSWTQTSGPAVSLANANTATPSFQTPAAGSSATVTLQLMVNDGTQNSSPKQVAVMLAPSVVPPVGGDSLNPVTVNVGNGSARIQLGWPGAPGSFAVIQASQDLLHWENIATNSASYLGALLHIDLQAGQHPRRFYRAISWQQPERPLTRAQLSFDGVNDSVEVPHSAALDCLPLTITAWFRTSQSSGSFPGLITKFNDDDLSGYGIGLDQGRLSYWYVADFFSFVIDDGNDGDLPLVADGQWHHVAFVVDIAGGRVYVDGSLARSSSWEGSPTVVTTTEPLRFGVYPGETGLFYNGDLDEVAVWNRAFTGAEINQMIPGQLTGSEAGLLGCWKLNDGTGQVATDSSGQGRNGTLLNGPQWTQSTAPLLPNLVAGSALRFDGVDDTVRVPHHAALNPFPLTVAGWIKTAQNSPAYVAIANKYPAGSGNGYSLHVHNGRLFGFYFRGDGASFVYATDPGLDGGFIADGQWHHVAYVVDANGGRVYVDGVQTASLGWTGTPGGCTTTSPLLFGQYPIGGQVLSLDGRLDELSIWNRALDATEVNGLMNNKQAGTAAGLLAYWPFDNGSGTTAADATGHGHTGTLQLGPFWVPSDAPIAP